MYLCVSTASTIQAAEPDTNNDTYDDTNFDIYIPLCGEGVKLALNDAEIGTHARIGNITFRIGDVFNLDIAEENRFVYRLANKLHNRTKKHVIKQQLLFQTGDPFSIRLLEESERILRNNKFIADAQIVPYQCKNNVIDIDVITRDSWSLTGGVHFSRSGGANKLSFEIDENNFIGLGKQLKLLRKLDIDRNESLISYTDNNVIGSRNKMSLMFSDKTDGVTSSITLDRPFYKLDSKWTAGFTYSLDDRTDPIYRFGEVVNEYQHKNEFLEIRGGLSDGYFKKVIYRWNFGFTKETDNYSTLPDTTNINDIPKDQDFRYPWASLKFIHDQYIKKTRISQLHRVEDVNLGNELDIKVGWSDKHVGALDEGLIYEATLNTAFALNNDQLILIKPYLDGRYIANKATNTVIGFDYKHYFPNFEKQVFYLSFNAEHSYNLDSNAQLSLGGDTGLRGYPLRFQQGERRLLLTLEQRLYTDWHWFQLLRVGGVAFFDVGRAWSSDTQKNDNTGILKDVGLGLRMSSSRTSSGVIVRFDLAFPLDGDSSIDNMQFLVTSSNTF